MSNGPINLSVEIESIRQRLASIERQLKDQSLTTSGPVDRHTSVVISELDAYLSVLDPSEKQQYLLTVLSEYNLGRNGRSPEYGNAFQPNGIVLSGDFLYYPPILSSDRGDPVKLAQAIAFKNNFRQRCGCDQTGTCNSENHGTSYVAVDYNHGVGQGRYDIIVRIRHYGAEYYTSWDRFVNPPTAYKLWTSQKLGGPGAPGREGYFSSGNNQTAGRHTGAMGVEVLERGSSNQVWWGIWFFAGGWGDWGDQWLRCGHDYNFWFVDN